VETRGNEVDMWVIVLIVGFLLGIFGFSNIIYPLLVAWPKAKKLEKEGKLIKPIPRSSFVIAPIIWFILISVSVWVIERFFSKYMILYVIVLAIGLIIVVVQIPRKNKNIEADFAETWKHYLKKED
jgi:uncharacterized membrane protein